MCIVLYSSKTIVLLILVVSFVVWLCDAVSVVTSEDVRPLITCRLATPPAACCLFLMTRRSSTGSSVGNCIRQLVAVSVSYLSATRFGAH